MTAVTEALLTQAVDKRREFLLENQQTLTMKLCHTFLEEDLGLPKGALKEHKRTIRPLVDAVLTSSAVEAVAGEASDQQPEPEPERHVEDGAGPPSKQGKRQRETKPAAKQRRGKGTSEDKPAGTESDQPKKRRRVRDGSGFARFEALKRLCKETSIHIPPSVYRKEHSLGEKEAALVELLGRHGLSEHSGPREVARVRGKLQLQRDLEGIDSGNIVEGGRRARRAAPADVPAACADADEDSEEESELDLPDEDTDVSEAPSEDEEDGLPEAAKGPGGQEVVCTVSSPGAADAASKGAVVALPGVPAKSKLQVEGRSRLNGAAAAASLPCSTTASAGGEQGMHRASNRQGPEQTGQRTAASGGSMEDDDAQPARTAVVGRRRMVSLDWSDDD